MGLDYGFYLQKAQGKNAKNWADLQLLLNCSGLRVDFKKPRGSLTKVPGRTGMFGSGLSDLDLKVRI